MTHHRATRHRPPRWAMRLAIVALTLTFLIASPLAGVPARLIHGCAKWIALASALELVSVLGFVVVFKLVFGAQMTWRQGAPAGLRALGASTILPAGGLVGPSAGALSASGDKASVARLSRATIAFVMLTNGPGLVVVAAVGTMLWLGWPSGPHQAALTLLPAGVAIAILVAARLTGRSPVAARALLDQPGRRWSLRLGKPVRILRDGVADAREVVTAGNWKLLGAFAYYAFDNAVLWAAFRAYGHTPPLSVVAMGYLIGSLGAALPVPGGVGAAEGGLIGALLLYGTPVTSAASAVLLYRSVSLALPGALGGVAWTWAPLATRSRTAARRLGRHHEPALQPSTELVLRCDPRAQPAPPVPRLVPRERGLTPTTARQIQAEALAEGAQTIPQAGRTA